MRNNGNPQQGNTKKFLYKSPQRDDQDDWIFSPRKNEQTPRADKELDMENVWSIKKNVSLGGAGVTGRVSNGNTDGLNLKANKTYYSRYGGVKAVILADIRPGVAIRLKLYITKAKNVEL
ncbi:hypothetical protein KP79_PYT07834 [Mizuhopecten yessoensis]|uniref:Uncharacterized protein n=1 Tax=Mizuhopecten yessoensis TaxID=6573 RepID=A0A210Q8H7_MIZYE|nr:hypothetical protein KP79_PYT07834 [Mizuhopecten yessoensis]